MRSKRKKSPHGMRMLSIEALSNVVRRVKIWRVGIESSESTDIIHRHQIRYYLSVASYHIYSVKHKLCAAVIPNKVSRMSTSSSLQYNKIKELFLRKAFVLAQWIAVFWLDNKLIDRYDWNSNFKQQMMHGVWHWCFTNWPLCWVYGCHESLF